MKSWAWAERAGLEVEHAEDITSDVLPHAWKIFRLGPLIVPWRLILSKLGMKRGVNPDGTLADTRVREGADAGKSLYPSYDIEAAARKLVEKYTPARATGAKGGPMPEPIRMLADMVKATDVARSKALNQATESLIQQRVNEQLAGYPLDDALREQVISNVRALIAPSGKKGTKAAEELARQLNIQKAAGLPAVGGKQGEVAVATGIQIGRAHV